MAKKKKAIPAQNDQQVIADLIWHATPAHFLNHLEPKRYTLPRHWVYMARKVATVAQGDKRIILQASVRHAKSTLTTFGTPAWYLDLWPDRNVCIATHTADFSQLWGRRIRNFLDEHKKKLRVRVSEDSSAAHSWETTAGGSLHTAGVGGAVEGRGFSLICVDDPVKDAEQAYSDVHSEKMWEWYTDMLMHRLDPGGSLVITMARWTHNDMIARLLQAAKDDDEADQWEVINLPALAEEGDELGRAPGEPLWPQKFSTPEYEAKRPKPRPEGEKWRNLDTIRASTTARSWAARYQQRPEPDTGGWFKRHNFRYYTNRDLWYELHDPATGYSEQVLKSECWRVIVADTATEKKTIADYSVRGVWDIQRKRRSDGGWVGGAMILVDLWREQANVPDVEAQFRTDVERFDPLFIGIEDCPASKHMIQRFAIDGLPVLALKTYSKDKLARSANAQVASENHRFWFPKRAKWLDIVETELLTFPTGDHDDVVDMIAHTANVAMDRDLWQNPESRSSPVKFEPGTYGHLLGHDKILNPDPKAVFYMDRAG